MQGPAQDGGGMRSMNLRERIVVGRESSAGSLTEFMWRGQRHQVRETRRVRKGDASGVRCRTDGGLHCLLARDPERGTWRIERIYAAGG